MCLKRMCSLLILDGMFCRYLLSQKSLMCQCHLRSLFNLLIFFLDNLSIDVSVVAQVLTWSLLFFLPDSVWIFLYSLHWCIRIFLPVSHLFSVWIVPCVDVFLMCLCGEVSSVFIFCHLILHFFFHFLKAALQAAEPLPLWQVSFVMGSGLWWVVHIPGCLLPFP